MLKRLNHIAIVVPDVKKAKEIYQQKFNAVVSDLKTYPEHGVTVVFIELENTKIELMEPYGKNSPIKKFLEKNPQGGMHHICLEVSDINKTISPVLKKDQDSELIYINFCKGLNISGSAFYQTLTSLGNTVHNTKKPKEIINIFNVIQDLIKNNQILSGHDISSGGLITSLLEMNFSNSNYGLNISTEDFKENDLIKILFNESPGIIIQTKKYTTSILDKTKIKYVKIGRLIKQRKLIIKHNNSDIKIDIDYFRDCWFKTSSLIDSNQTKHNLNVKRFLNYKNQKLKYKFPSFFNGTHSKISYKKNIRAAVIREKGINSEREMAYMLYMSGFDVKDVHMTDLVSGKENLEDIHMVVFPGGFSNSDVLGSAKGWAGVFKYNKNAKNAIFNFYKRNNTLSLGVCNGCQLMMELNLLFPKLKNNHPKMEINKSEKFECIFTSVDILKNNSVMLKNLEGTTLGIWSAHGEGRFNFKNKNHNIAAKFHYKDYPSNPNGSDYSAAMLSSKDGRHLAMMPHLERSIFPWNWAHYEPSRNDKITPWILPFVNARNWLETNT